MKPTRPLTGLVAAVHTPGITLAFVGGTREGPSLSLDERRARKAGTGVAWSVLSALRKLFEQRIAPEIGKTAPEAHEHGLRLAAAALLFEVVRADATVKDEERTVVRTAVQSTFGLSRDESEELVRLAEAASRSAGSLYEFTSLVDHELAPDQKKRLVELLWLVAFADGEKDAHEEHLVRRIAGLLHVPHPDFIDAKIRARAESGLERG